MIKTIFTQVKSVRLCLWQNSNLQPGEVVLTCLFCLQEWSPPSPSWRRCASCVWLQTTCSSFCPVKWLTEESACGVSSYRWAQVDQVFGSDTTRPNGSTNTKDITVGHIRNCIFKTNKVLLDKSLVYLYTTRSSSLNKSEYSTRVRQLSYSCVLPPCRPTSLMSTRWKVSPLSLTRSVWRWLQKTYPEPWRQSKTPNLLKSSWPRSTAPVWPSLLSWWDGRHNK